MMEGIFKKVSSIFSGSSGADRRRHARFLCDHDTTIRITDVSGRRDVLYGTLRNLSISGALFEPEQASNREFPDYHEYHLLLDGMPRFITIVRVSFNGLHCAFEENLTEEELKEFLRTHGVRKGPSAPD